MFYGTWWPTFWRSFIESVWGFPKQPRPWSQPFMKRRRLNGFLECMLHIYTFRDKGVGFATNLIGKPCNSLFSSVKSCMLICSTSSIMGWERQWYWINIYIYIHIHFKWPLGYQEQTPSMLALNSLEELLGSCAKVSYYNHVGCDVI